MFYFVLYHKKFYKGFFIELFMEKEIDGLKKEKISKKNSINCKIKENPWMLSTIILGVLLLAFLILGNNSAGVTGQVAGENFVDFFNENGANIELVESKDFGSDLYELTLLADGQEIPAHVTKDGKYFVNSGNLVKKEDISDLKERLQQIKDYSRKELAQAYRTKLRESTDNEENGAGLGLLEMARKSSEKIYFNFDKIDDKYEFYTLTIRI